MPHATPSGTPVAYRVRFTRGGPSVVADHVVHDVVVDHVVMNHVMMRMPTGRQHQKRRHQSHRRHGRQAKPLTHHVLPLDIHTLRHFSARIQKIRMSVRNQRRNTRTRGSLRNRASGAVSRMAFG